MEHKATVTGNQSGNPKKEFENKDPYSSDAGFEQMSVPDGGTGNKEALDDLKRAGK